MARLVPYNNLDFSNIKANLLGHLRNQEQFKGFDFEGSNMNVLVDLMAYNAYQNMIYYNMTIGEMFLDSAQVKNSVVSHAKELNYLPRSRRSAGAVVDLVITSPQTSNSFIIPKGYRFQGRCGGVSYNFITSKSYVATRTATNTFEVKDVAIFEGRIISEVLSYDDTLLSNPYIDTRSITVTVNDVPFSLATTIFGVGERDAVYYVQAELNDKYSIQFGDNIFGYQPTATDKIVATYRVCSGPEANGVASYTCNATAIGARSIIVKPQGVSVGAAESESIQSIRKYAPKALQVQDRAITTYDYEVLLKRRFPEIESISVFGGDEADPPQFGRVIVVVDVQGRDGASESELALYKDFISSKSPLTIEPVFKSADFMYGNLAVDVVYDRNDTLISTGAIEGLVRDAITTYSNNNLNKFSARLSLSDLGYNISVANQAIVSASVTAHPIIDYKPPLQVTQNPTFHFNQRLVKPYPYTDANGLLDYKPALKSTKFTIDDTLVELQDDGNGLIQAIVANTNERSIYKKSIGTVDYDNGIVSLKNLKVDNFEGNSIQIIVNIADNDIVTPKDRIFRLRQSDITVNLRPN
jgi:hypothetical protein